MVHTVNYCRNIKHYISQIKDSLLQKEILLFSQYHPKYIILYSRKYSTGLAYLIFRLQCALSEHYKRNVHFFLLLGLLLLNILIPRGLTPTASAVTPGCCNTWSRVVFFMAAGEIFSWSAKY